MVLAEKGLLNDEIQLAVICEKSAGHGVCDQLKLENRIPTRKSTLCKKIGISRYNPKLLVSL